MCGVCVCVSPCLAHNKLHACTCPCRRRLLLSLTTSLFAACVTISQSTTRPSCLTMTHFRAACYHKQWKVSGTIATAGDGGMHLYFTGPEEDMNVLCIAFVSARREGMCTSFECS